MLALDHGEARCGCAVSDPSGTLATPLAVVERPETRKGLARIAALAEELGAERVLVGLPLTLAGEEGEQAARAREFAGRLGPRLRVPVDLYDETFRAFNSLISPWHQWLDPVAYRRHVDEVEAMGVLTVASAHGGVHTGAAIHAAFDRVRALAGEPITPDPGQPALDELLAASLLAAGTGS